MAIKIVPAVESPRTPEEIVGDGLPAPQAAAMNELASRPALHPEPFA